MAKPRMAPSENPAPTPNQMDVEERIRARAYEIYLERGPGSGLESGLEDWLQAEAEIRSESA